MHRAVELLLARMDSNPDEFDMRSGRWIGEINEIVDYASEEDKTALYAKLDSVRLEAVYARIVRKLAGPSAPNGPVVQSDELDVKLVEEYKKAVRDAYNKRASDAVAKAFSKSTSGE